MHLASSLMLIFLNEDLYQYTSVLWLKKPQNEIDSDATITGDKESIIKKLIQNMWLFNFSNITYLYTFEFTVNLKRLM